ncbi:MAG: primosomal protein N', partial [Clostridium sp.]
MDVDTTRKKGEYEKIYREFKNHQKDILIGTQMVSKGMDFENVILVGVISADITLNIPDFRASEKTFQILTQVAGRAGRGEKEGKVIIQTYSPNHFSIECAKNHDYNEFYKKEIENRRTLNYPPFSELIHIVLTSEKESILENTTKLLSVKIKNSINNIVVIGPSPCQVFKIKDKYRWHIILKGNLDNKKALVLDLIQKNVQNKDINYIIDVNPYSLT